MNITVTSGTGVAKTTLAAFDKALNEANIANYNLLYLSSVIPSGSKIVIKKPDTKNEEYGHKLYCVMSKKFETEPYKEVWAGIGWVQSEDGCGLFVEHSGESETEVKDLINASLSDMVKYRPGYKYGNIKHKLAGIKCKNNPVCALAVAVYQSQSWDKN